MKYEVDPEFLSCVHQTYKELNIPVDRPTPRFPKGDVEARRKGASFAKVVLALEPDVPGIIKTRHTVPREDGFEVPVFQYRKEKASAESGPAVLYFHGGGMIFGSAELFEAVTKKDVEETGVMHFSVDYRVAPEVRHPTPVEDCYAALLWVYSNAKDLGVDNSRIAMVGLSAGGGLAAALSLMARDRGLYPAIAKQILLTPMLDDRNIETDAELLPLTTWTWDDNWTGWNALLDGKAGSSDISAYAAPARTKDLKGLPRTYVDIGNLDIFAKEAEAFVKRLKEAGVDVEWHLYEGVPHGFEFRGRKSQIHQRARANRCAAIKCI